MTRSGWEYRANFVDRLTPSEPTDDEEDCYTVDTIGEFREQRG